MYDTVLAYKLLALQAFLRSYNTENKQEFVAPDLFISFNLTCLKDVPGKGNGIHIQETSPGILDFIFLLTNASPFSYFRQPQVRVYVPNLKTLRDTIPHSFYSLPFCTYLC